MVKLVNARRDGKFSETKVNATPATLASPQKHGFDYAIVNTYQNEEPVMLTEQQTLAMFSDPEFPAEVLTIVNPHILAAVHKHRLETDVEYAELFKEDK